jgi:hypothetical protein
MPFMNPAAALWTEENAAAIGPIVQGIRLPGPAALKRCIALKVFVSVPILSFYATVLFRRQTDLVAVATGAGSMAVPILNNR